MNILEIRKTSKNFYFLQNISQKDKDEPFFLWLIFIPPFLTSVIA